MSKCDISIDFYRPDREFRTGETVQGWVRIRVEKNIKCRGLQLVAFWKTHGRGNTTRKNYFQEDLFQGEWQVGETYEYPFRIPPPESPLTYHGHYINIDHYVSVRADIPWAMDPHHTQEFMWRAGSFKEQPAPNLVTNADDSGCGARIAMVVAGTTAIAAVTGLVMTKKLLFLLLLIPAALLAFLGSRRFLAERKLGKVAWETPAVIHSGTTLTTNLKIGPVGNVRIREITASISGIEYAVSGSGTDATTHTHEIHHNTTTVAAEPPLKLGKALELNPMFEIPVTDACSLELPDNRIRWHLSLAIRLRGWPDWVQQREIALFASPQNTEDENPNPAFAVKSLHELVELADQLVNLKHHPKRVEKLISEYSEQMFTVSIEISDVAEAASDFMDQDYQNGRTLTGKLNAGQVFVSLQLPSRYNQQVDSMVRGTLFSCECAIIRWDTIQNQLVLLGI